MRKWQDVLTADDQHLLQVAPAHSLLRLKKEELERLWKVAGMWPDEDDVAMEDGPDVPNGRQEKSKSELVDGILQFVSGMSYRLTIRGGNPHCWHPLHCGRRH